MTEAPRCPLEEYCISAIRGIIYKESDRSDVVGVFSVVTKSLIPSLPRCITRNPPVSHLACTGVLRDGLRFDMIRATVIKTPITSLNHTREGKKAVVADTRGRHVTIMIRQHLFTVALNRGIIEIPVEPVLRLRRSDGDRGLLYCTLYCITMRRRQRNDN